MSRLEPTLGHCIACLIFLCGRLGPTSAFVRDPTSLLLVLELCFDLGLWGVESFNSLRWISYHSIVDHTLVESLGGGVE